MSASCPSTSSCAHAKSTDRRALFKGPAVLIADHCLLNAFQCGNKMKCKTRISYSVETRSFPYFFCSVRKFASCADEQRKLQMVVIIRHWQLWRNSNHKQF
jgi:hypothetical protein